MEENRKIHIWKKDKNLKIKIFDYFYYLVNEEKAQVYLFCLFFIF